MNKDIKIFVAGHSGMVGSAIVRELKEQGYSNLCLQSHSQLDLINQQAVNSFFKREQPELVIIAAARVGGIQANNTYRGQFIYENLMIQSNIIHTAHLYSVKKLLFLGSACIYPRDAKQPIKEEYLLGDYLESTNEPYAIAKIAGIKLCENYFHQYQNNFYSVMPNNLYGTNDNFNLETAHVLPALLRKFHEAKVNNRNKVEVWGTGNPLREFLHVDDLANACVFLLNKLNAEDIYSQGISHINIGSGEEVTINELAEIIKKILHYKGKIIFNPKYPDGTPRKLLNIDRINNLNWKSNISLEKGIKQTYKWFLSKYEIE